jgi:hypothetical protein
MLARQINELTDAMIAAIGVAFAASPSGLDNDIREIADLGVRDEAHADPKRRRI